MKITYMSSNSGQDATKFHPRSGKNDKCRLDMDIVWHNEVGSSIYQTPQIAELYRYSIDLFHLIYMIVMAKRRLLLQHLFDTLKFYKVKMVLLHLDGPIQITNMYLIPHHYYMILIMMVKWKL